MTQEKMKEAVQKILRDNAEGDWKQQSFRDMITQELLGVLTNTSPKGKMGATVLTPDASMYNPKEHGPRGPKPESL